VQLISSDVCNEFFQTVFAKQVDHPSVNKEKGLAKTVSPSCSNTLSFKNQGSNQTACSLDYQEQPAQNLQSSLWKNIF